MSVMKKQLIIFIKGILAGLSIGVGGLLYLTMIRYVDGELGKVLGSILFAIGLFTVCSCYLMLFTGKIGMVFEGKQDRSFYISLPVMLIGNAIGAFLLGYVCYFLFRNTNIMDAVNATCDSRISLYTFNDYLSLIVKSLLCGTCVYLAVKSFSLNRLKPIGIALLVFFVFVFVYSGVQHCIANMFYFVFGNCITINTFINLIICIIGNSVGTIPGVLLLKLIKKNK